MGKAASSYEQKVKVRMKRFHALVFLWLLVRYTRDSGCRVAGLLVLRELGPELLLQATGIMSADARADVEELLARIETGA